MDELEVELLYCHYGWTPQRIAALLDQPVMFVEESIRVRNLTAKSAVVPYEESPDGSVQRLRENEVEKQMLIAPILAIIELDLLSKLRVAVEKLDMERPRAADELPRLVKAYKALTQDMVSNTAAQAEPPKEPGVAVQVVTNVP